MSNLYYIGWTSRMTGSKGHGVAKFPLSIAQQVTDHMNKSDSGKWCYHYLVVADDEVDVQQIPQGDSI